MPAFSKDLELSLHRALTLANEHKHEFATLEHLLLALLEEQDARVVLEACSVDIEILAAQLKEYIEDELIGLVVDDGEDCKPTAGFQRVIQRAVIHVQSSGRDEVTGANVIVALFAERESHAAFFLQEQEMTRYDAVNLSPMVWLKNQAHRKIARFMASMMKRVASWTLAMVRRSRLTVLI